MRVYAGTEKEITVSVKGSKKRIPLTIEFSFDVKDPEMEWGVIYEDLDLITPSSPKTLVYEVKPGDIHLRVVPPKGAYLGDTMRMKVVAGDDTYTFEFVVHPAIVVLKTTIGQEEQVAIDIMKRAEINEDSNLLSVLLPHNLKGYVFVEVLHPSEITRLIRGLRAVKGVVRGETTVDEIKHYLTPKPAVTGLQIGAIVEIVEGPFRGERARVMQVDEAKDEVTLQLIEAMVPIPITVRADAVRLIDREVS